MLFLIGYGANFLWVLVIGLFGPSIPSIVRDLNIDYPRAGLLFTSLSLGTLIGGPLGAIASDYTNKKRLLLFFSAFLTAGLVSFGYIRSYYALLLLCFGVSLLGSPLGASSQSVILYLFPDRREGYLSLQTMFAAFGSLLAPILVIINYNTAIGWRWAFIDAGFFSFFLFIFLLFSRIPEVKDARARVPLKIIFKNRTVLFAAIIVFFAISMDIGFAYWLAEYFSSELMVSMKYSSGVVAIYLAGLVITRASTPFLLKKARIERLLPSAILLAVVSLASMIFTPHPLIKAVLILFYGLGIGPVFPLMMATGVKAFPRQPGVVTGVVFSALSLGGMVFPFLLGKIAESSGIESAYFLNVVIGCGILFAVLFWFKKGKIETTR